MMTLSLRHDASEGVFVYFGLVSYKKKFKKIIKSTKKNEKKTIKPPKKNNCAGA